jgi:NADH:ubiquinone oxidoreductase subunit E
MITEETKNVDCYKGVGEILSEDQKKKGVLIHAFQEIQREYNYLPEDKLMELSKNLGIPLSYVYSTASFYKHFDSGRGVALLT